jgi:hypothetical protein
MAKSKRTTKEEAIAVTWSQQMLNEGFGNEAEFRKAFEEINNTEDGCWLQKMNCRPTQDVLYCFIIIAGKVAYRCNISHYNMTGEPIRIRKPGDPKSFSNHQVIRWKHVVLTGPIIKAPKDIEMRGFQGFRYVPVLF